MVAPATADGLVVSDLHVFRRYSQTAQLLPKLLQSASTKDFLVLNGDIFDFNWSVLPSIEQTVSAAAEWLVELIVRLPRCRIFYVMGNHDGLKPWANRLDELTRSFRGQFSWVQAVLQLDDCWFFHGDLPLFRPDCDPFQRRLHPQGKSRGRAARVLHALGMRLNVHRLAYRLFPPIRCARTIMFACERHQPDALARVRRIFFGHTHNAFPHFLYRGIAFANSGAALLGVRFLPIAVTVAGESLLTA